MYVCMYVYIYSGIYKKLTSVMENLCNNQLNMYSWRKTAAVSPPKKKMVKFDHMFRVLFMAFPHGLWSSQHHWAFLVDFFDSQWIDAHTRQPGNRRGHKNRCIAVCHETFI